MAQHWTSSIRTGFSWFPQLTSAGQFRYYMQQQSQTIPPLESLSTLETWESSLFERPEAHSLGSQNLYSVKQQDGSPAVPRRWGAQGCCFKVRSVQTVSIRVCPQSGSPLTPSMSGRQFGVLRSRPPQEGFAVGLGFFPLCRKSRSGFWVFTFLAFL